MSAAATSSRGDVSGHQRKGGEKESSGTMQLLDRLGYGVVSLSSSPDASEESKAEGISGRCEHRNGQLTDEEYSAPFSLMDPTVADTGCLSAQQRRRQQQHLQSCSAAANLASLSRIRALVTNTDRRIGGPNGENVWPGGGGSGPGGGGTRRKSSTPDAATIFRGVRVLLEQNACGLPGSEEVALECLSALKESVAWLSRTIVEGSGQEVNLAISASRTSSTPAPRLHGPNHGAHVARACIASIVPSVIECFSRMNLCGPAEDVLAECATRKLPDVSSILVDQLVHHGMEHDDRSIRLWSTRVSSRLLVRGLSLEQREYGSLLKGLLGRVRDVDDGVVDAAVDVLGQIHHAEPDTFRMGEECLDPVHRQLLQHYASRIYCPRDNGGGITDQSGKNREHGHERGFDGGASDIRNVRAAERGAVVDVVDGGQRTRKAGRETATEMELTTEAESKQAAADHSRFSTPPDSAQVKEAEVVQSSSDLSSEISSSGDTSSGGGSAEESEDDDDDEEEEDDDDDDDDEDDTTATSTSSCSGDAGRNSNTGVGSSSSSSSSSSSTRTSDGSYGEDGEVDKEDNGDEDRPKFEPIVEGITIPVLTTDPGENPGACATKLCSGSGAGGAGGDGDGGLEVVASVNAAPKAARALWAETPKDGTSTRTVSAVIEAPKEIRKPILASSSSSSIGTGSSSNLGEHHDYTKGKGHRRQEEDQQVLHRGTFSPPRPVLAGPAATEVVAMLGYERDVGFCAATAGKNLIAARKARAGVRHGSGLTVSVGGAGMKPSSTATSSTPPKTAQTDIASAATVAVAVREKHAPATKKATPTPTALTMNPTAPPSQRGRLSPRGEDTPTTAAKVPESQPPKRFISNEDTSPLLPPLALGELLSTLAEVDAEGGGRGADRRARDGAGSSSPTTRPSASVVGGVTCDWSASGTAGARRQGRITAMEEAKRLAFDMTIGARRGGRQGQGRRADGASGSESVNQASWSRLGETIGMVLRLTGDADFKIALLALQTMQGLVATIGKHLRPHLAVSLQTLVPRLGDRKVAARHHVMVVLCTLVRIARLPSAAPLLAQHGLRSPAWRTREGTLRLVIAGLLSWQPPSSSGCEKGADAGGRRRDNVSVEGQLAPSKKASGIDGRGYRSDIASATGEGREEIVRNVGLLLKDERPEVRFAAVEALAVAANIWNREGVDVPDVLEDAKLLSSPESRRRMTARLQDPPSSLSRLGPDETVILGSALTPWRASPDHATARRRRMAAGQEANQRLAGDEDYEDSFVEVAGGSVGGSSTGGNSGVTAGKTALRCWRNNEAGEREEVDPWEHHHGGGVGEPCATTSTNVNGGDHHSQSFAHRRGRRNRGGDGAGAGAGAGAGSRPGGVGTGSRIVLDGEGRGSGCAAQGSRRKGPRVGSDSKAGIDSALASPPYNEGGSGGDRKGHGATPPRRASSPNLSSGGSSGHKRDGGGVSSGDGRRGGDGGGSEIHTYTPSWAERNGRGTQYNGPAPGASWASHQGRRVADSDDPIRSPDVAAGRRRGPPCSPRGERLWGTLEDSEGEASLGGPWGDKERSRRGPAGCPKRANAGRDGADNGCLERVERMAGEEKGASCCPVVPDPDLLSTLKRGGSRNARASRRAVSAAAGGGTALLSGPDGGQSSGGDPASSAYDGGGGGRSRSRPRGGPPAEPTTPVPVGRYDGMGRRSHMETTAQQPLPLSLNKGSGGGGAWCRSDGGALGAETFVTGIDTDSEYGRSGGQRDTSLASTTPDGNNRQDFHKQDGVSSASKRRRERREAGGKDFEDRAGEEEGKEAQYRGKDETGGEPTSKSNGRGGRRGLAGEGGGIKGGGDGFGSRRQWGGMSPGGRAGGATVFPPSASSALNKPDSFDYLTAEDIRPSPNPSQELQRTMASLPRDNWPEIFHTLNSVRRLAMHHAALLGSQSHLHALVRDVLAQSENLRSQVAKNALLALADLWRGLGDTLDPELPMVCPGLVKKLADKVEFLAEAARECVDELVATATESRALSAFLACGSHRSPAVRAKAALSILLCVRRRCYDSADRSSSRASSQRGRGDRGVSKRAAGGVGTREMDRLLSTLPRFLQDGNQETRHHAKAIVAVLLDTGEVDEARLRREIPPPILERLQRELLNSSLPSGPGFTAPYAATPSSACSSYGSRRRHSSSSAINRGLGATGPAFSSSCLVSSPGGSNSSIASGGSRGLRRRRPGGSDSCCGGGDTWVVAGAECWRDGEDSDDHRRGKRDRSNTHVERCDDIGGEDELGPGLLSSPPHRAPPPLSRSKRWAGEESEVGSSSDTDDRNRPGQRAEAGSNDGSQHTPRHKRQGLFSSAARAASKTPPRRDSGGGSAKRRPNKVFHCREAELLPAVYARLDSGDWRERLKGLEETTDLLEEHGSGLHAAGKSARLLDRMTELLSDGNLKVNLRALEGVVRLGSSLGNKLESVVNTLVPAVCRNLASSNQQRIALAEEALDALCEAIDPCLIVQPVSSLAQYGNARLKVPMLSLLQDLTPEVGQVKPILLTKYVRPAALSLVRESHPNVRDAGLSLLREVEIALHPVSPRGSRQGGAGRSDGRQERDEREYKRDAGAGGRGALEGGGRARDERSRERSSVYGGRRDRRPEFRQGYDRRADSALTSNGGRTG